MMGRQYQLMQTISNFIVLTNEAEQFRCGSCFQINHKVVRLTCPCRKCICLPCLRRDSRCSVCLMMSEVEPIEVARFQFHCLSNSPLCTAIFDSEHELLKHCVEQCPQMDLSLRDELKHALNYECRSGHRLQIANSYGGCNTCNARRCKSRCTSCPQQKREGGSQGYYSNFSNGYCGYCVLCRPIPCTTRQCPSYHNIVQSQNRSATCDLCDISVSRFPKPSHSDRSCDFDICSYCFRSLAEEHPLLPGNPNETKMDLEE